MDCSQARPIAQWNTARGVWETATSALFCEHSEPFRETWPRWGMTRAGVAYQLPQPERLTAGKECSSWLFPTPTAQLNEPAPWKQGVDWWLQSRATRNLEGIVTGNTPMMPTPNARDWKGPSGKNYGSGGLPETAALFSSPRASDGGWDGGEGGKGARGSSAGWGLRNEVRGLFPTPNSRDWKGGNAAVGRTESGKRMRTEGQIDFPEAIKLLPTPDTGQTPNGHGRRGGSSDNGHQSGSSLDVVVKDLLPTPRASMAENSTTRRTPSQMQERHRHGLYLSSEVCELFPTPSAGVFNDGEDLQSWEERRQRNLAKGINGNGQGTPLSIAVQAAERDAEPSSPWGRYEAAIRRWEAVLDRPSPPPTEQGKTGPRLSPRFTEFVMGLPDGWVTDVPGVSRREQLHCLGNGVVPQQAALALRILLGET